MEGSSFVAAFVVFVYGSHPDGAGPRRGFSLDRDPGFRKENGST